VRNAGGRRLVERTEPDRIGERVRVRKPDGLARPERVAQPHRVAQRHGIGQRHGIAQSHRVAQRDDWSRSRHRRRRRYRVPGHLRPGRDRKLDHVDESPGRARPR
jgi:hypothetical protein